jgi:hypothetical protein
VEFLIRGSRWGPNDGEEFFMETFPRLPNPEICKTERFIVSADYWTCLVAEPDPCLCAVKIGNVKICSIASKSGATLKRKIEEKKIFVRYADASFGVVPRRKLDELIEAGRITAFERSSGWVDITKGPLRSKASHWQFKGLQRRAVW